MTVIPKPTALIVEDDADLRATIAESLESNGFAAAQAADGGDAIARVSGFAYDAIVIDLSLPDTSGMQVLDAALERYPDIRAVLITGCGGVTDAVAAIKRGAVDFLIKPFQLSQLARVLHTSLEQLRLRQENAELRAQLRERFRFENIIGQHPTMQRLFATLERVAPMNSTILIHGETGTGKELVARTLHLNSPRAEHRFVAFNAAAIPEALAEAELFGHVKGAFTGAVASRAGRFELAHRGTLFIDEVASMPLPLQSKLLRALQEREVERVGDSRAMKLDLRVVAATGTDLRRLVREGKFREDLYYRLNVIPVQLPALRDRIEDIPLLASFFVKKSCSANRLQPKRLTQEALRALMAYEWPGNIRQLENAIEHAVAMSPNDELGLETLPPDVCGGTTAAVVNQVTIPDEGLDFTSAVTRLERDLILSCLQKTGGNKRRAARLLQLSRSTFIDKLQRLKIDDPAVA
jgi:DNA-binding NtrC family response regulator